MAAGGQGRVRDQVYLSLVPDPVSLASQPLSLDCATPREEKGLV